MQEQAGLIQQEVTKMLKDVARLDQRVDNLEKHFGQAEKDLKAIRTSAEKVSKGGERITELEFGENRSLTEHHERRKRGSIPLMHELQE